MNACGLSAVQVAHEVGGSMDRMLTGNELTREEAIFRVWLHWRLQTRCTLLIRFPATLMLGVFMVSPLGFEPRTP